MSGKKSKRVSRREFLKSAAAGAAIVSVVPMILVPRRIEAYEGGSSIHPHINPLRVVGIHDPKMATGMKPISTWKEQERMLNAELISNNMDRLASALAGEKNPDDGWKKIFIKPPQKSWADTVVAIKSNFIGSQRTRSAVLQKVCRVLVSNFGVKGSNIYLYDACHGGAMSKWKPACALPEGVNVAGQWGSYNIATSVPQPWKDGKNKSRCLDHLVKGTVDILIDIALCKGHGQNFGGFTMCMKNHFGTFNPGPSHAPGGGADYLIAINKTPEILGKMDPKSGKVLYPRQQLCIIDALWASKPGPGGDSTAQPNRIYMGTFAPALDYQVGTKFRKGIMGWDTNIGLAERFLTDFGFSKGNLPNGGKIMEVPAA